MELREQFEQAIVDSKNLKTKPDNQILLKLYSLYKQSTEGNVNTEPPSNPFDFVAKAKYQAWEGLRGKSADDAMQEYVELIKELKGN
ncbi:MAG: acyl-CoA-binding protein [Bacteroidia bacterium]|nr:acyl-CoA-binding protein [Bacteroidia bacterium]